MATLTVAATVARVQVLLDDPAGRRFRSSYILPLIDAANEESSVPLEALGIQQQEQIVAFDVPAAVSAPLDLTSYFAVGQPLENLLRPRLVEWKLQGQPDVEYAFSDRVDHLDDVDAGNVGCQEYIWSGATIKMTPSYTAVTLRLTFWGLAVTINSTNQTVMRGIGHLLALAVAEAIAASNNSMGKLQQNLEARKVKAWRSFKNLLIMEKQAELIVPRGTKRGTAAQISAGGVPYS